MNKLYKKILHINWFPNFLSILLVIGINWTFQSILYMDKSEKIFKILIDLVLIIIISILLSNLTNLYVALLLSVFIAHTINWIVNGHIFALFKTFGLVKTEPEKFIQYINYLKYKSSNENSVIFVATFGSLSRDELNENSDLDIRIVRKKGLINGINACLFTMIERSNAFFNKFPLDIYLLDNFDGLNKLKEDPVLIYTI